MRLVRIMIAPHWVSASALFHYRAQLIPCYIPQLAARGAAQSLLLLGAYRNQNHCVHSSVHPMFSSTTFPCMLLAIKDCLIHSHCTA